MAEAKWYGVSSGDGNNGVSHMFADYYVKTAEPYRLAELAVLTLFKREAIDWANRCSIASSRMLLNLGTRLRYLTQAPS